MKIANPVAKKGEELAEALLLKKGYKIVDRNFRKGYGEIDIVAIDLSENENTLVFIEVKTRTSKTFGSPFESVTFWKLKTLIKTAQFYKLTHRNLPENLRIDAISVTLSSNGTFIDIEHIKNIS